MQAVILAGGEGRRMWPMTLTRPKPMLPVLDKTILEHNLEQLDGIITEAIIVIGYKGAMIQEALGDRYGKIKIVYVKQEKQIGSGDAVLCAKPNLKDRFLVMNGDDLYSRKEIKNCIKNKYCVLGKKVSDPEKWGILTTKDKRLVRIVEKPKEFAGDMANCGLYVLDMEAMDISLKKSERGEYEIVDVVSELAKREEVTVETVEDYWIPIGYPWHLLEANVQFLNKIAKSSIKGTVEENVTIKGNVTVGEGTTIKSGTYIEGPVWIGKDCEIGPMAYLRKDTIILDRVRTRAEIVDSLLMKGATAKHDCYIGHSVIGENCNIGAGTITADYRHDGKSNTTVVNGNKIDSGRRKLGAFIGDNAKTAINTSILPGRKIWPGKTTLPGETVRKDVE
jgi:UDP-N-acetylglucosamine diphosphorylase/glucosamine-1-phosphate N-acetyltransferase